MKPAAALYHRVSTRDQNVTLAREELRSFARARGYRVTLDVEEKGSGARNDRPGLRRVLEAARCGQVQAVLVWKLDRWGRSALDILGNVQQVRDVGARFICTSQSIEVGPGAGGAGAMVLTCLAAVAELERELIQERTNLGLARARKLGKHLGRPVSTPPELGARVLELRRGGHSWRECRKRLRFPETTLRRAYARAAKPRRRERGRQQRTP